MLYAAILSLFLLTSPFGSAQALYDEYDVTFDTKLTELVDVHMKNDIVRLLPKSDQDQFFARYYDQYDVLDGLDINSLLAMFGKAQADPKSCATCNQLMALGKTALKTPEVITGLLSGICKDSESLSKRVCTGLLDRMAKPVAWLFTNSPLQSEEICSVLVGFKCLDYLHFPSNESVFWELELPPRREFKPLKVSEGKKKVLHLTDVHLDLWYEPSSNSSCNEPLCCRVTSQDWKGKDIPTGHWSQVGGDCDIPQYFVSDSLRRIAQQHPDLDAVYWTGDNVPHDVWNTTQKINLRHIHTVSGMVSVAFNNIPVFPVLGNHETHPINLYIPQSVIKNDSTHSNAWLYETLATDYWSRWLDSDENKRTFQKGGYYSKSINPSWKVVVLNTNIAQKGNFWILFRPDDHDEQLQWLIKELDQAEAAGSYVTILGHIPPKHDLFDAWIHNYIRIVDRYSHIITAGFFGHTHKDEVTVLYNLDRKPINVNFISGSLTTFSNLNPNYAIYEVDNRGMPQDSSFYLTDIDAANIAFEANHTSTPKWQLEYRPKISYRLADMTAASWHRFIEQAQTDLDLAELYAGHYHRYSVEFAQRNFSEIRQLLRSARRYSPYLQLDDGEHEDPS